MEHLGCSQRWPIVTNTAINMDVQVSLSYPEAHSFRYMPRSGITGSYDSSIFSILRNLYTDFHSSWTNLYHHHHQVDKGCFFTNPYQHLLLFILLIIVILMEWNLNVVLSCISFMVKDAEHFFKYLWNICASAFWELFLQLICPFIWWVVDSFSGFNIWVPLTFWLLIPCQMFSWQRFSPIIQGVSSV
jgi:hypothetical protein